MTASDRPALDVAELRRAAVLPGGEWRSVDVIAETGSTNADLLARAETGHDIRGAVLAAEFQSTGRGRQGRVWSAPARAQLAVSVGIDAQGVPSSAWGLLPLAAGVAVVEAVFDVTGIRVGVKWPNDVLAGDGSKLAGLLAEVSSRSAVIVMGIGLNVSLTEDELPGIGATSLARLGAGELDRTPLLIALLGRLGEQVSRWRRGDERLLEAYRRHSVTLGQRVRAELPGERSITGMATDVDAQGRLLIDGAGESFAVSAGDVVHLRPEAQ